MYTCINTGRIYIYIYTKREVFTLIRNTDNKLQLDNHRHNLSNEKEQPKLNLPTENFWSTSKVYEIIKKHNTKFELIWEPIHFKIVAFLSLD